MSGKKFKIKEWPLNRLTIRYFCMPGKISSSYRWRGAANSVNLVINLAGNVDLQMNSDLNPINFQPNTCNLFYATDPEGSVINRDTFNEMLVVQFEVGYFMELMQQHGLTKLPFVEGVKSKKYILLLNQSSLITQAIERSCSEIINLAVDEKYRGLMLSAKWPELLLYVFDLSEKQGAKKWVHCKTEYDKERIQFARNYLLQQAGNPPSLSELSRIAGINQLKLKEGFKEIFGNTPYAYLNEYRLEKAQKEIADDTKSLTQIAFELGYSSLPHFSLAYKKKFGRSPGALKHR